MFRCVLCSENHQTSMMSSLFIICHFLFWAPGGWYGNNNTNIIINNKARAAGPGLELGLYGWERPAWARVRRLYRTSLCSWHFFTASVNKAKNRKHLRLQIQRSRWRFNRNGLRHINIWTHFCPERSNTPKHRFDICLLERRRFPLHDEDDDLLKLLQTVKQSKHSCLQVKGQPAALWCGHSWYFFITHVYFYFTEEYMYFCTTCHVTHAGCGLVPVQLNPLVSALHTAVTTAPLHVWSSDHKRDAQTSVDVRSCRSEILSKLTKWKFAIRFESSTKTITNIWLTAASCFSTATIQTRRQRREARLDRNTRGNYQSLSITEASSWQRTRRRPSGSPENCSRGSSQSSHWAPD